MQVSMQVNAFYSIRAPIFFIYRLFLEDKNSNFITTGTASTYIVLDYGTCDTLPHRAQESIPPAYVACVAWRTGTQIGLSYRPARPHRLHGRIDSLRIDSWESIPGLLKGLQIRAQFLEIMMDFALDSAKYFSCGALRRHLRS
jgi:hypothetical protein